MNADIDREMYSLESEHKQALDKIINQCYEKLDEMQRTIGELINSIEDSPVICAAKLSISDRDGSFVNIESDDNSTRRAGMLTASLMLMSGTILDIMMSSKRPGYVKTISTNTAAEILVDLLCEHFPEDLKQIGFTDYRHFRDALGVGMVIDKMGAVRTILLEYDNLTTRKFDLDE